MQRSLPPFRADHVGSLLRSPRLKDARTKHADGSLPTAELTAIENEEIKKIIAKQEALGLASITDGEFRRAYWHFDFLSGLDGVEMVEAEGIKFAGVTSKSEAPFVNGKLGSKRHPQVEGRHSVSQALRQVLGVALGPCRSVCDGHDVHAPW